MQLDALHLSLVILLRRPVTQQTKKRKMCVLVLYAGAFGHTT
jgi:hypothetical protein